MSLTITTDVFCDGEGCLEWIFGTTGGRSDATTARRRAKAAGWVRRQGRDLCPACAKAPR